MAGVTYAFSGLTQSALMWPNNSAASGLLPWVLLLVEAGCRNGGRPLLTSVFVGSLQMLTGAPAIILFTWILAALRLAFMASPEGAGLLPWQRFGLHVGLIAALCAVQLLPFSSPSSICSYILNAVPPGKTSGLRVRWCLGIILYRSFGRSKPRPATSIRPTSSGWSQVMPASAP